MRNERSGFEQAVRRSTGARRLRRTLALALASAALASGVAAAADSEVVRTLRAELSGADAERFVVENLAGTMWIKPSADPEDRRITVVATVHAESDALADGMRLERVTGDSGAATLRVRYPADVATVR